MDNQAFEETFEEQVDICRSMLIAKAKEYASDVDRLHNFKSAAALEGTSVREALGGMMVKHTVSVYDMIFSDKTYDLEVWGEKINDHINYLILLKAVLVEQSKMPQKVDVRASVGAMRLPIDRNEKVL